MNKLTRRGIAYNLSVSPHHYSIHYSGVMDHKISYVFSSEFYRNKFINSFKENRIKISESLSNRFGFNVENDILADLKLYTQIEKRGFLIFCNGVSVECPESITLDGKNPIVRT